MALNSTIALGAPDEQIIVRTFHGLLITDKYFCVSNTCEVAALLKVILHRFDIGLILKTFQTNVWNANLVLSLFLVTFNIRKGFLLCITLSCRWMDPGQAIEQCYTDHHT